MLILSGMSCILILYEYCKQNDICKNILFILCLVICMIKYWAIQKRRLGHDSTNDFIQELYITAAAYGRQKSGLCFHRVIV